ncbi:MAG: DDE-type integrase/transposase/recombinase [Dehalococcoidia bacterium]
MVDFCCKYCGSTNIVRYGRENAVQYWWCKNCHRKFADNDALPDMKTPIIQVSSALSMYYRGMSIDEIRQHLDQQYNNCPSSSTIYDWICRFSDEADRKTRDYKPNVGYVWLADETILDIAGKKVWFWDLIDVKTRFLLASHMSFNRTTQNAQSLVEKAVARAGKSPKVIITDSLWAYLDGIELALGGDTRHVQSRGFMLKPNTNLIERFHGILKSRTKVMRGLKTPESALLFLDGWLAFYNFFRPHEGLGNKTPAEKAGLNVPLKDWLDVVKQSKGSQRYTSLYPRLIVNLGVPTKYNIRRKKKHWIRRQPKEVTLTASSFRMPK